MTLRFRVAIFISVIFALLATSLFYVFNVTLMGGFLELEDQSTRRNTTRVIEGIKTLEEEVATKVEEWGTWDDSYSYIQKRNLNYEKSNLTYDALDQLHLRHFLMTNLEGKVIKGIFVNTQTEKLENLSPQALDIFGRVAQQVLNSKSKSAGIVELDGAMFMMGAAPVMNSAGDAPMKGTVLFSRNFSEEEFKKLEELTRTTIQIRALDALDREPLFSSAAEEAIARNTATIRLTPDKIFGVDVVRDIFEKPLRAIVVPLNRDILAKGLQARNIVTCYILTFTLLALAIALVLLNRIVIAPLRQIGEQTKEIGSEKLEERRIALVGDKEISHLALDINRMLDSLAEAHREVVAARKDAEAANAAKSMFIARVSHELRTPVGGIVGINRIIRRQEGLSRAVRELVEMGDLTAHSLLNIVDEILDFAKAESGELSFESIPFDIREVARQTMQTIAGRLEGKYKPEDKERVQLVCDIDPRVPSRVVGDPTKLKQILVNLLGNAVKFTQKGNIGLKIEVGKQSMEKAEVRFVVWDTGIGIPPEKLQTVFEPFKQAEASTSRKYQGTGLGLSIVKQFTEGLGGTVAVESKKGAGAVFTAALTFTVPDESAYILKTKSVIQKLSWPEHPMLVAGASLASATLTKNLSQLGAPADHVDPQSIVDDPQMLSHLHQADLLIVTEEALNFPSVTQIVEERASTKSGCTIALLRPSNLELREALYEKGLEYVLPTPVIADDLILAFLGKLPQPGKAVSKTQSTVPQSFHRKLKVLVVDDISTNRIILEDMLAEAGHDVYAASDGSEMVERLLPYIKGEAGAEYFDVVLTDVSMAIMDGDEATRVVREIEAQYKSKMHVPIIAVTAHALKEEQEKIRASGVDGVLVKPIYPENIEAEFQRLFGNKETLPEGRLEPLSER